MGVSFLHACESYKHFMVRYWAELQECWGRSSGGHFQFQFSAVADCFSHWILVLVTISYHQLNSPIRYSMVEADYPLPEAISIPKYVAYLQQEKQLPQWARRHEAGVSHQSGLGPWRLSITILGIQRSPIITRHLLI